MRFKSEQSFCLMFFCLLFFLVTLSYFFIQGSFDIVAIGGMVDND